MTYTPTEEQLQIASALCHHFKTSSHSKLSCLVYSKENTVYISKSTFLSTKQSKKIVVKIIVTKELTIECYTAGTVVTTGYKSVDPYEVLYPHSKYQALEPGSIEKLIEKIDNLLE